MDLKYILRRGGTAFHKTKNKTYYKTPVN